ncbi:uncharacterized protein LOC127714504 [Mytilus californianus]|uniref:uncharacterized protein LOC127714504 n=1 Tax=Mytilus californianus TaxID=6549 RepID=UPI002248473C|nr:uncharacterized protein LOC127714504 [Mytilus californianus]
MEMILIKSMTYLLCIILSVMQVKGLAYGVCKVRERSVGDKIVKVEGCCNNFYKKNEVCVECPIGHSSEGKQCEKCVNGQYGVKCAELCHCNATERCDHVRGCITVTVDDRTEKTNPPIDSYAPEQAAEHDDVVTYMTCVAVGSVLVVICGLLAKNREAVCRRNGSITAMENEITKRKRPNFGPCKINGKDKKESLYAEINEKYMINFDGE